MAINSPQLGATVGDLRHEFGVTQQEVALNIGVTVNFISQLENGRRGISVAKLSKLANFFGIPTSFVYVLADESESPAVGRLQKIVWDSIRARKGNLIEV